MIKNLTRLEHKIGDRIYHLFCDQDSPVVEVKEALMKFLDFAANVEEAAKAAEIAKNEKVQSEDVDKPEEN